MMTLQRSQDIPEPILQLQQQLDQWRGTQRKRAKLPESFWQSAVDLARQYGVYQTAHPLRLDYVRLKGRLAGRARPRRKPARPAFVELVASPPAKLEECGIEFESARGAKMRIQFKASAPPDWAGLLRAWREVEG